MDKVSHILFETATGGAVVAFLIWAFKEWYSIWLKNRRSKRNQNHTEGQRAISRVYYALEELKDTKEIESAVIYEISNGGNCPKPGSKMFMSALYIKHDEREQEKILLDRYNKTQIDDSVINMCVNVLESDKPYVLDVSTHPPCQLKDNATVEKLSYQEYYGIYVDGQEEKSFIMALSASGGKEKFQGNHIRAVINTHRNLIKQEFKKQREVA